MIAATTIHRWCGWAEALGGLMGYSWFAGCAPRWSWQGIVARMSRWRGVALGCSWLMCSSCASDEGGGRGSPTGTTLEPRAGLDGGGYDVVDEVCGSVNDPGYLTRFETPMFRAVAVVDEVAYLLDGSLLWAV